MDTTIQCTDLILWQPRASYTTVLSPDQPQTGSYEVLESYDTFPYTPSPLAIHVIPRLTPLSFFPHRLPWLRAVMASDPHGLLPTPFPLQITTLINSLPFSSHALQSDRLRPPIFAEVTKNRGPSNRPEELVMLIEAPDTLLPHVTEVIEAQLSEKSSVTPSAMCGRPTVTDGPGQEERRTETAEPGEMELQEKEAEAREREKEEGRVEEEEAFEPGEQVESVDTVKEAERAEEMGQAEDMVSVKEGDGMEPGEETEEGNAKSIEGGGAGLTKLKKAPEGARNESKEVREVQTGKEWEGAEVEAQQQSITIATAGDCGEQSLGDEVNCIVNLPDDNTASSAFPPIADGLEPFHSGMIGDELRQRNLEHMSNADGRTEEEEKEKVSKAGPEPVMPTPTTDTSSTYHIDPNPLAISSGHFTEKVDDSPAELLSSQDSNGSLDILCSSPIGSQEGDKAEDRLTQNDQAAGASPPALPDEGDEIVDSKEAKDSASSGEEEEGPELPMLQPSFSRFAQPAPVLARRTLKRKDTMQDLFSAMVPLKRKKVELTRKPAVWDQSDLQADSSGKEKGKEATGVEEKEVELEEEVDKDVLVLQGTEPTADAETRAEKPSDLLEDDPALSEEEDPKKGQWRVGRLPGHQGSHIKRDVDGVFDPEDSGKRGQKRSLGQSINDSAERVLKKPFRLPARVVLKPAPPRSKTPPSTSAPPSSSPLPSDPRSSSPSSSRTQTSGPTRSKPSSRPFSVPRKIDITPIKPSFPTRTSTPVLPPTPQSGTSTSTIRSSPFKSSPTFSRRLAKPFKTPFSRSTAPSPVSSTSRSKTPSTRELIAELEKEERTLKQAIKYHKEPEEDERLVELITTWRDAGQQVAELLFAIYPRPDSDAVNGGESSNNKPFSMYPDEQSFFARSEYTPEQLRYIANLDTNADGDPVDNDGMPIFGNGGGGMAMDIEGMLEQRSGDSDGDRADGKATSKETDSTEWTIGTMLVKLGVEPGMYAWDAEVEDWGKPEEE